MSSSSGCGNALRKRESGTRWAMWNSQVSVESGPSCATVSRKATSSGM